MTISDKILYFGLGLALGIVLLIVGLLLLSNKYQKVIEETLINDTFNSQLAGGWITVEDYTITPDIQNMVNQVAPDYTPIALLSTQVVSGINYKVLTKKDDKYYIMIIYNNLENNSSLTEVKEL